MIAVQLMRDAVHDPGNLVPRDSAAVLQRQPGSEGATPAASVDGCSCRWRPLRQTGSRTNRKTQRATESP